MVLWPAAVFVCPGQEIDAAGFTDCFTVEAALSLNVCLFYSMTLLGKLLPMGGVVAENKRETNKLAVEPSQCCLRLQMTPAWCGIFLYSVSKPNLSQLRSVPSYYSLGGNITSLAGLFYPWSFCPPIITGIWRHWGHAPPIASPLMKEDFPSDMQ